MKVPVPIRGRSRYLRDFAIAVLVAALLFIGSGVSLKDDFEISMSGGGIGRFLPDPWGTVLILCGSLPLTFRRAAPLTVFAVIVSASLGYRMLGYAPELLPVGVLIALYTVAVRRQPWVASVAGAVYIVTLIVETFTGWLPVTDDQFYIHLVSVVATVTLGYGVALGRARASLAEQRAAGLARDHAVLMRGAMEQEQARIAREVHDIVAHDVSVIVAQAATARRVSATAPEKASEALVSIEAVGRDALDGLRRLVGLLRTQPDEGDRSPQPSLARLPWLLAQLERAGLPVTLTIEGEPCALPTTVELNAYRIIQEALTNSLKHAGPTRAWVTLTYEPDAVRVEVRDEGGGAVRQRVSTPGYGLISMQQRTAMLGGELVVGPRTGRGFGVSVRLPVSGGTP
jgi:signal transduction histidine kinase